MSWDGFIEVEGGLAAYPEQQQQLAASSGSLAASSNSLTSPSATLVAAAAVAAAATTPGDSPMLSAAVPSPPTLSTRASVPARLSTSAQRQRGDSMRSVGSTQLQQQQRSRGNSGVAPSSPYARARGESMRSQGGGSNGSGNNSFRQRARGDSTRSAGGVSERSNKEKREYDFANWDAVGGSPSDLSAGLPLGADSDDEGVAGDGGMLLLGRADSIVSVDDPSSPLFSGVVARVGEVVSVDREVVVGAFVTASADFIGRAPPGRVGRLAGVSTHTAGFVIVDWLDGSPASEHKAGGSDGQKVHELVYAAAPRLPPPGAAVTDANCIASAFVRRGPGWSRARYGDQDQPGGVGRIVKAEGDGWCLVEWLLGSRNSYRLQPCTSTGSATTAAASGMQLALSNSLSLNGSGALGGAQEVAPAELVYASAEDADLVLRLAEAERRRGAGGQRRRGQKIATTGSTPSPSLSSNRPDTVRRIIDDDDDDDACDSNSDSLRDEEEEEEEHDVPPKLPPRRFNSALHTIRSRAPLSSSLKKSDSLSAAGPRHVQLSPYPATDPLEQQRLHVSRSPSLPPAAATSVAAAAAAQLGNTSFASTQAAQSDGKVAQSGSNSNSITQPSAATLQLAASLGSNPKLAHNVDVDDADEDDDDDSSVAVRAPARRYSPGLPTAATASPSSEVVVVEPLFADIPQQPESKRRNDGDANVGHEPTEYRPQWSKRASRYYCGLRYTEDGECDCGRCNGRCGPSNGCQCPLCEDATPKFCGRSFTTDPAPAAAGVDDAAAAQKQRKLICGPLWGCCPSCYDMAFPMTVRKASRREQKQQHIDPRLSSDSVLSGNGSSAAAASDAFARFGSGLNNSSGSVTSSLAGSTVATAGSGSPLSPTAAVAPVPEILAGVLPSNFIFNQRDFVLKHRIGRGGGGEVFEAIMCNQQLQTRWPVAIKYFNSDFCGPDDDDDEAALRVAVREAKQCFSLSHNNIVRVIGVFTYERARRDAPYQMPAYSEIMLQQAANKASAGTTTAAAAAAASSMSKPVLSLAMVMELAETNLHAVLTACTTDHTHAHHHHHHHHHHRAQQSRKPAVANHSNNNININKQQHHDSHAAAEAASCGAEEDDKPAPASAPAPGLPLHVVESYALQIFEGLSYLHSLQPKIVHRDVKPANILATSRTIEGHYSRLALCDLGLAAALERSKGHVTHAGRGTYRFSSPSQFLTNEVTTADDVYSAAGILYWMICNREPWREYAHMICVPTQNVVPLCEQVTQYVRADVAGADSPYRYLLDLCVAGLQLDAAARPTAKRAVACIRARSMQPPSPELSGDFTPTRSNTNEESSSAAGGKQRKRGDGDGTATSGGMQSQASESFMADLDDTNYQVVAQQPQPQQQQQQ